VSDPLSLLSSLFLIIVCSSRGGFQKAASVVGLAVFTQYWYWYPLVHFVSLSLVPSALTGLTGDLCLPAGERTFSPECACPPSWFAYPTPMSDKKEDKKAAVTVIELSTAAKARARAKGKEGVVTGVTGAGAGDKVEVESEKKEEKKEDAPAKKEKEVDHFPLINPCRVSPGQSKFVTLPTAMSGHRYTPLTREGGRTAGVVMLIDNRPHEPAPDAPAEAEAGPAVPAASPTAAAAGSAAAPAPAAPAPAAVPTAGPASLRGIRAPTSGQAEEKEAPAPKTFEWTIGDYYGAPGGGAGAGAGSS
jgi:26S proteasome regulatory subunit N2